MAAEIKHFAAAVSRLVQEPNPPPNETATYGKIPEFKCINNQFFADYLLFLKFLKISVLRSIFCNHEIQPVIPEILYESNVIFTEQQN
jgi:hypothetical protein